MVSVIWDYTHFRMMTESEVPKKIVFEKKVLYKIDPKRTVDFQWNITCKGMINPKCIFCNVLCILHNFKIFWKTFPWSFLVLWQGMLFLILHISNHNLMQNVLFFLAISKIICGNIFHEKNWTFCIATISVLYFSTK